jgi:plasmid maintenance system antidote protein VapI
MEARFWLNLQTEFDMRMTERQSREDMVARIRVFKPATV